MNLPPINQKYFTILVLFNCSLLLSIASGSWNHQFISAFIIISLFLQFIDRKFWWSTFLSILAFLAIYVPNFPRTTNHGNLEVFFGLFLLIFFGFKYKKIIYGKLPPTIISNCFRFTLVTIYFITGFNKLNESFFDISATCCISINSNLNGLIFGSDFQPSTLFIRASQLLAIFTEMIVPFGLLFKNTRKISAILLVLFHFYLSLSGFSNFSALAGFLIAGSIINFEQDNSNAINNKGLKTYIAFSVLSVIVSYLISRFQLVEGDMIRFYNGFVYNIGWLVLFYQLIKDNNFNEKKQFYYIPFIPLAFIFLWASQAYIGLTNTGNLTMFSNLLTEKTKTNHYLIDTNYTKIFNFEEDLVYIKELPEDLKWENSENLEGFYLPLIEFKVQANNWVKESSSEINCILVHKGKTIRINNLKESQFSEIEWWYPLLHFRKIPKNNLQPCAW